MTAVSALAKDNHYRIIIMMGGVTTNLLAQTNERLQTHLREASGEWTWLMLTNPTLKGDRVEITSLTQEWRSDQYEEEDRRTLFIAVMKNHGRIRQLAELLSSINLSDIPAIIFDDEADQASLNTRPTDPVASTTYATIGALRRALPSHTYLQYTATPQAPLLIARIDSLSADFAELVSPGEGYTGGREFFGQHIAHIEDIPESDIYDDADLPIDPPQSLVHAMQVFFVGVSAGRIASMRSHRSMLVHPSRRTATHQQYYTWVNDIKVDWHGLLLSVDNLDRDDLIAEFRGAYDDLSRTCADLPEFDAVVDKLPVAVNQTTITMVNSADGREVPWDNGFSHILVGGEKLGRGYTVKGLTVTYMPRPPGGWTADTIQQRARFFGYHASYMGYCRVYLHPDVRDAYVAYVDHEDDMRARLADHSGRPLAEWRRLFYLDKKLRPTRQNVLSSPYLRPRFTEGWFSPRAPHVSPGDGARNLTVVRLLDHLTFTPHSEYAQHRYAVVPLEEIFERILAALSYLDDQDGLGLCVVNCHLTSVLEDDPKARCLIYLMDGGKTRSRTATNGAIPQLFQGRSSKRGPSYPGDRVFFDTNLTTVQVHMLRVTDDQKVFEDVPALAVRLSNQKDILVQPD